MVYYQSMVENISNVEYASLLYDFYGDLLDEHKNRIMKLYHEDNLSLAEIAGEMQLSRQGVHYTLKKAEKALEKYEEKLGLVRKYLRGLRMQEKAREIAWKRKNDERLPEDVRTDFGTLEAIIDDLME